jgi:hypothetical protein
MSITVDIANNTLTLDDELLPVANVSGNIVTVDAPGKWGDRVWVYLNRVTGKVLITTSNDEGQVAWKFDAACKPAQKLF